MQSTIKKRISSILIILGFCFSLGLGYTLARVKTQPKMRLALSYLKDAKKQLNQAAQNKGGHRVKALEHVKEAIKEVKKGIKYANKH